MANGNHDTWTLSPGSGTQSIPGRYWEGNTLSNLLIDQSASNAAVKHSIGRSNATIENVGLKGKADVGGNNYVFAMTDGVGNVTFDTLFLSGCKPEADDFMAIYAHPTFDGHADIVNCFVQYYSDNGMYLGAPVKDGGGTVAIENCYAYNNNICGFRPGTDGSYVRGSKAVVDDYASVIPAATGKNARGIFTVYGNEEVDIENCHIYTPSSASFHGVGSTINVSDTEYNGGAHGAVNLQSGNGSNPDTSVPSGIPTDAESAASGETDGVSPSPPGNGDDSPNNGDGGWVGDEPSGGNGNDNTDEAQAGFSLGPLATGAVLTGSYYAYKNIGQE